MGVRNTMLKTVSGKKVSMGDIVVIKSIDYVRKAYGEHIPYGYPPDMEKDACGRICVVDYVYDDVYNDGLLELTVLFENIDIDGWCIGAHMVEPIEENDVINLNEIQILAIINYL